MLFWACNAGPLLSLYLERFDDQMTRSHLNSKFSFLRQEVFQLFVLSGMLTFVLWSLLTLRQADEEQFRFEALSRCRVLEVAIADILHQGMVPQIAQIQQRIDRLVQNDHRIVRLSVIAKGADGRYVHIASSLPSRIGKPANQEDLVAISSGEIIFLEEPYGKTGALDITYPVRDFDGKVIALLGYTVSREFHIYQTLVLGSLGLLTFCLLLFHLWQARMLSRQDNEIQKNLRQQLEAEESLREMAEELHRAKKMEAIGLLAGGVAHDLNNMLVGVVGIPDLMLQEGPLTPQQQKQLVTIRETGIRISDVVNDMQTLSRSSAASWEAVDLNQLIDEYLISPEFIDRQKTGQIELVTELASELSVVVGKRTHLRKVVMNLVVNAMEAAGSQGQITIRTLEQRLTEPLVGYETIPPGNYVRLQVQDSGPGIAPEIMERIFEPFFSRKVMGKSGTGLGLAICWSIVHDHGGFFDLPTSHSGAVFEVYLPASGRAAASTAASLPAVLPRGAGEQVLVVDDEEVPRQVAGDMLRSLGYQVLVAASGEEAVRLLDTEKVELVLLDMMMDPGINGLETYRRILERHPGQKALIVSGQAETVDVDEALALGASKFLKKPLSLHKLATAVAAELRQKD